MAGIKSYWKFTRPHTIVGSAISVSALYSMATLTFNYLSTTFLLSFFSALACNIFITGYNQVVDVELDKINKPYLPLAAGEISISTGRAIVYSCLGVSLLLAAFDSIFLFALISVIALLGFAYSFKRLYLKRHHQTAAISITLVRGILVNIGFYLHFHPSPVIPTEIWILTVFITLFSLGIAWFKDIPDIKGDRGYQIGSLAVKYGAQKAFTLGTIIVGLAYVIGAFSPIFLEFTYATEAGITLGHGLLGFFFLWKAKDVKLFSGKEMSRFYQTFWLLFFAEYLLFTACFFV